MITTLKTCFKCGAEKPLAEFYKHAKMSDGHLNKCKTCARKDVAENRKRNLEYYRKYDRKRGSRQSVEDIRLYRKNNPNKYKAHCILNNALRDGKITPKSCCENCNSSFHVIAHHTDYNKPLEVEWLCQVCHVRWHQINGEGLNGK